MVIIDEIAHQLQSGRARETSALVTQAIAENCTIDTIVRHGFIAGITAVEKRYRRNEILIPEVHMAIRAMNWGMRQIKLSMAAPESESKGTVIIGTVKGDTEDMGKNLIALMMEYRGLRVIDLGTSVTQEQFIETAAAENARIILCSAALVTTMVEMKNLVQYAVSLGMRDKMKILLFGAPVTERYCQLIGADMYAPDAVVAAEMASAYYA
jgi:methanogenic corrinoid protein MtbC1